MMRHLGALVLCVIATAAFARADTRTIAVSDVWSRPAAGTAVIYATLRNRAPKPDRLIGASSPFAIRVELHQSVETKTATASAPMAGMPMNGSMIVMRSLSSIPIPAHGATSLSPGGYHLMLDLRWDIKAGEVIPLRLHFARAGWIATNARVRPLR